jgi:glycerol-3-phosphate O-acyltransferase
MEAIGAVIPVVPVALVAWVFRAAPGQVRSEFEVKAEAAALLKQWEQRGVHVYIPRGDRDYAVGVGLRMLALRHVVEETEEGTYRVRPDNRPLLDYYANSIAHVAESGAAAPRTGAWCAGPSGIPDHPAD